MSKNSGRAGDDIDVQDGLDDPQVKSLTQIGKYLRITSLLQQTLEQQATLTPSKTKDSKRSEGAKLSEFA